MAAMGPSFTRREVLKVGAAGAALVLTGGYACAAEMKPRPNILLLMADQFRGDCLGCDGNPVIQTPNLDCLASEGVRFNHAYSCTPTCTPARAALLTGLGPWRNGMLGYGKVAEKYPIEMPQALRDAGYYTTGIGKMHWSPQRCLHGFHQTLLDESGRAQSPDFRSDYRAWFYSQAPTQDPDCTGIGWNDYRSAEYALPQDLHPTTWTANTACNFIESYDRPEPFFLKVSFARPHSPYDPPSKWMQVYRDVELPKAAIGDWESKYAPRSDDSFNIWHGDLGPDQVRASRQGYYGSISFLDKQIGRILHILAMRGQLENTLILFTADHGDMTGDHHLWRKSYAYEPSARIPMIARWPGSMITAQRGQVHGDPVELRDVLPTFLDIAGAPGSEKLEGKSLLALVRGDRQAWREFIDLEHDICYAPENHWNALTDGHSKYIFNAFDGSEQFFDLDQDPHECRDLVADPACRERVQSWRERLVKHLEPRGENYVSNGKLILRQKSHLYSPNYPKGEG